MVRVIEKALSLIGVREGGKEHKNIIDTYNKITPLPQGYKVKYTDSWCATFVSYLFSVSGVKNFPFECSCPRMIEKAKKDKLWIENDAYVPAVGDCVLYDWQDNGAGDDTGTADHIGVIESVTKSGIITVIEGNYSDSVKRRKISANGRYIRGFIASSKLLKDEKPAKKKVTKNVVDMVIAGKYGVGDVRVKKLQQEGYEPKKVQEAVNKRLKG